MICFLNPGTCCWKGHTLASMLFSNFHNLTILHIKLILPSFNRTKNSIVKNMTMFWVLIQWDTQKNDFRSGFLFLCNVVSIVMWTYLSSNYMCSLLFVVLSFFLTSLSLLLFHIPRSHTPLKVVISRRKS